MIFSAGICDADVHHDALRGLAKTKIDAEEGRHNSKDIEDHADDFDPARTFSADKLRRNRQGRDVLLIGTAASSCPIASVVKETA